MVLTRGEALRQPILAPDVERELIKAWQERQDEKALDRISRAYSRLCYSTAAKYTRDEHRMQCLAQEGTFGVRKAIEKYDPSKGTKFSTYLRPWIQNYIAMEAPRVLNDITVPARAFIDARMGRLPPGKNDSAVFATMPFATLDAPLDDENATPQIDMLLKDENTPERIVAEADFQLSVHANIERALSGLTPREMAVVRRRKLQDPPDTLEEISVDFGVTRERIRQIEADALEKMKIALMNCGFDAVSFFRD